MSLLRWYVDWLRGTSQARSPEWWRVRLEHLAREPECQCCGGTKKLEVHHILPVHIAQQYELEPNNLITLCEERGCHFLIGHLADWRCWNPLVREDAAFIRRRIKERKCREE